MPLFRRRAYVDINFLVPTQEPSAENKKRTYHDDHKDHEHRYDPCATSTTVVTHDFPPLNGLIELTCGGFATEERQDSSCHITRNFSEHSANTAP